MTFIIGIAGPSCSGKTTLVNELKNSKFSLDIIHADNYFKHYKEFPKLPNGWRNTELPENIKSEELIKDLVLLKENSKKDIIIIEGYLIFHFKQILELLNLKIFIKVSESNQLERRLDRKGHFSDKDFIKQIVIPAYQKYSKQFCKI
ncbi:MAG: AAA family ATPase, partial [Nanoarchaeota archaeon]|nr:AAA family ATPase [Nanoarchaeota archaeon]